MNTRKLRRVLTLPKRTTTPTKLPAELILGVLTTMRKQIPFLNQAPPRPSEDSRTRAIDGLPLETVEDFEWAAVIDGIESLANDLAAVVAQKQAAVLEEALRVYYITEELARDPEHADLIELVEKMRAAYERDFGKPIPAKGEK